MTRPAHSPRRARASRGFTLIEAVLATVVIGIGVVALMQLLTAGTMSNAEGIRQTTATQLAAEIRELAARSPYTGLVVLHNQTYDPPVDAGLRVMTEMRSWSQRITVTAADPDDLTRTVSTGSPRARRITVDVRRNGQSVYTTSWLQFEPSD